MGGVLGLGVIIALLLLWWYLKGRDRTGKQEKLESAASSREGLSGPRQITTPYNLDQPDEVNADAEKTAVNTPYGPSTSQLQSPQGQYYVS